MAGVLLPSWDDNSLEADYCQDLSLMKNQKWGFLSFGCLFPVCSHGRQRQCQDLTFPMAVASILCLKLHAQMRRQSCEF